jgi:hypothetical protein
MTNWSWAGASRRGTSHERCGAPRQDAFRIVGPDGDGDFLTVVACDGAGSASHGGAGAAIAALTLAYCARTWLSATACLPGAEAVTCWMLLARERIAHAATKRGLDPRDFATTAVIAISDGASTITAHVGDGAVVARFAPSRDWIALSWPEQGEYASMTRFLTEEGSISLRIARHDGLIDRLAVMTDGLERLALDFRACVPHAAFLEPMAAPLAARRIGGHDRDLSRALYAYLGGERVNERTDDDKTLVLAARA